MSRGEGERGEKKRLPLMGVARGGGVWKVAFAMKEYPCSMAVVLLQLIAEEETTAPELRRVLMARTSGGLSPTQPAVASELNRLLKAGLVGVRQAKPGESWVGGTWSLTKEGERRAKEQLEAMRALVGAAS